MSFLISVIKQTVIMLNVVKLSVVAPRKLLVTLAKCNVHRKESKIKFLRVLNGTLQTS